MLSQGEINLYRYCNNNPTLFIDTYGYIPNWLLDWISAFGSLRAIHNFVQEEIVPIYKYVPEVGVVTGGKMGRIDLLDPRTGSIWEIKSGQTNKNLSTSLANAQLSRYLAGTLNSTSINATMSLNIHGTIEAGEFQATINGMSYRIFYWQESPGVILINGKKIIRIFLLPPHMSIPLI